MCQRAGALLWLFGGPEVWLVLLTGFKTEIFSQIYIVSLCLKSIGFRSTSRRLGKVYCSNRPGAIFFLKDGVWVELAGGEGSV